MNSDVIDLDTNEGSFVPSILEAEANEILSKLPPCHLPMVATIKDALPAIKRDIDVFGRTQSQFMDRVLTCSHPTPIRNIRQMLSEINRAWSALRETWFNLQLKQADIDVILEEMAVETSPAKKKRMGIQVAKLQSEIEASAHPISGAVRKIRALLDQIEAVKKKIGKDHITEADFEADEARYHVMRAFDQALCAARSRGRIDEGNHIYLSQIGVNGMMAQAEIDHRLEVEKAMIFSKEHPECPAPEVHQKWLEKMADKYAPLSSRLSESRGFLPTTVQPALLIEMGKDSA